MRLILKEILVSTIPSVHVVEAVDSVSAIEMYNKEKPNLVTMDMNLPGTDGITCMKEILNVDPNAKILMISAINRKQVIDDALNSGALGFIPKPFDRNSIISKVKELLDENKLNQIIHH